MRADRTAVHAEADGEIAEVLARPGQQVDAKDSQVVLRSRRSATAGSWNRNSTWMPDAVRTVRGRRGTAACNITNSLPALGRKRIVSRQLTGRSGSNTMKALLEFLRGVSLIADVYVYPRHYAPLSKRGPHRDAVSLTSDCRQVGSDVRSALASSDVESAY